jgi:trimethylamine:corrinoid methyltransferase-like protein
MDHFRTELFLPATFVRSNRASPAAAEDLPQRARARAAQILREHVVNPPLDRAVEAKLLAFLKKAMKRPAAQPKPPSVRVSTEAVSTL